MLVFLLLIIGSYIYYNKLLKVPESNLSLKPSLSASLKDKKDIYVLKNWNLKQMVEVFKTNVQDPDNANLLLDQIHKTFKGYKANFDLEDCDKILRIVFTSELMDSSALINLLQGYGFEAEILPDL